MHNSDYNGTRISPLYANLYHRTSYRDMGRTTVSEAQPAFGHNLYMTSDKIKNSMYGISSQQNTDAYVYDAQDEELFSKDGFSDMFVNKIEQLNTQLASVSKLTHTVKRPQDTSYIELLISELPELIKDNVICYICFDLTYVPIMLNCGHTICESCHDKLKIFNSKQTSKEVVVSSGSYPHFKYETVIAYTSKCPYYCDTTIFLNESTIDYSLKNILDKLVIRCPYKCEWSGEMHLMNDHMTICSSNKTQCNKCNTIIDKNNIKKHERTCIYNVILCKKCGKSGFLLHMLDHNTNHCGHREITCCKCKKNVIVNQLLAHKLDKQKCTGDKVAINKDGKKKLTLAKCKTCHKYINKDKYDIHVIVCEDKKSDNDKQQQKYLRKYGKL